MIGYKGDNEEFVEEVLEVSDMLEKAVAWISVNMSPEDVFDDDKLEDWAYDNGFEKEEEEDDDED